MKFWLSVGSGVVLLGILGFGLWPRVDVETPAGKERNSSSLKQAGSKESPVAKLSPSHPEQVQEENRIAFYRALAERQASRSEQDQEQQLEELQREAERLLESAKSSGEWTESQAVRLHSIHQTLGSERSKKSLLALKELIEEGAVTLNF